MRKINKIWKHELGDVDASSEKGDREREKEQENLEWGPPKYDSIYQAQNSLVFS
jgi:hypothetical protein